MPSVLRASLRHYRQQQRFSLLALTQAQRTWRTKNWPVLTALMLYLQGQSAQAGIDSVTEMAIEQEVEAPLVANPVASSLVGFTSGGADLPSLLEGAENLDELLMTVQTQLADASRVAQGLAVTARPSYTGYVRYLNPPSCSRCVILAGRIYKYSDGFQRHPNCDCFMVPVEAGVNASQYHTDPLEAFEKGQITGLTNAQDKAIREGADIAQVINVNRKEAGLTIAGRVLERGGRPTPEGIYALFSDRDEIIQQLIKHGYLTA